MEGIRLCVRCERTLPLTEFNKSRSRPGRPGGTVGYQSWCKQCFLEYGRQWRADNPDRWKELKTKARRKRPAATRACAIVSRAILKGELTRQPCQICGKPNAEAHHEDYSRPFDINWLCTKHHAALHVRKRAAGHAPKEIQMALL